MNIVEIEPDFLNIEDIPTSYYNTSLKSYTNINLDLLSIRSQASNPEYKKLLIDFFKSKFDSIGQFNNYIINKNTVEGLISISKMKIGERHEYNNKWEIKEGESTTSYISNFFTPSMYYSKKRGQGGIYNIVSSEEILDQIRIFT
jgi:hypothetical protein